MPDAPPVPRRRAQAAPLLALLALLASVWPCLGQEAAFPLDLGGQEVSVWAAAEREDLTARIASALGGLEPSVQSEDRVQFDFQARPDLAPLTLWLDFDDSGKLAGVGLDALTQQQNPPAARLVAWLSAKAGPGSRKGKTILWDHAGFRFVLTRIVNAGEDSAYRLEATPR